MDLGSDCGALWMEASLAEASGAAEVAKAFNVLQLCFLGPAGLHQHAGFGVPDLLAEWLDALEGEHAEVCAALQDNLPPPSPMSPGHLMELRQLEAEAARERQQRNAVEEEVREECGRLAEAEASARERHRELALLGRENDLLRRQDLEHRQSQARMLRLVDDLAKQRLSLSRSQQLVAARLGNLQESLPLHMLSAAGAPPRSPAVGRRPGSRGTSPRSSRSPPPSPSAAPHEQHRLLWRK